MSKTMDELCDVFGQASGAEYERWLLRGRGVPDPSTHMRRAGIAAVVRALRDEIDRIWIGEDMGCGTILNVFNEILGDAGDEVAGAEGVEMPTSAVAQAKTPATDPAPAERSDATAVCEWTKRGDNDPGFYSTPHGLCHINHLPKSGGCWCGNPIKFTEEK